MSYINSPYEKYREITELTQFKFQLFENILGICKQSSHQKDFTTLQVAQIQKAVFDALKDHPGLIPDKDIKEIRIFCRFSHQNKYQKHSYLASIQKIAEDYIYKPN